MIRPNDVILYKPTGEKFVVYGVDKEQENVIVWGKSFAKLSADDCELVDEKYQTKTQINMLREHGLTKYIDIFSLTRLGRCIVCGGGVAEDKLKPCTALYKNSYPDGVPICDNCCEDCHKTISMIGMSGKELKCEFMKSEEK